MRIHEIVAAVRSTGSYYFDRKTLKFFGQRISDFSVYHRNQRIFICAPRRFGFTCGEYHPATKTITSLTKEQLHALLQ